MPVRTSSLSYGQKNGLKRAKKMKSETKSIAFKKLNNKKIRILKKSIISIEKQPNFNNEIDTILCLKSGKIIIIKE